MPSYPTTEAPMDGPCDAWITWADVTSCCKHDLSGVSEGDQASIIAEVSDLLYRLSGGRYPGICTITRTYCPPAGACGPRSGCRSRCRCNPSALLDLGAKYPVTDIAEVLVDGVELTEDLDYRLDDWRWLRRLDGEAWPATVDLDDPESLEVTFSYGVAIPAGGIRAAGLLACEYAAACLNLECQLPQRVTNITREGITYTMVDSFSMLEKGLTGIYRVDAWLASLSFGDGGQSDGPGGIFDPSAKAAAHALGTGSGAT